MVIELPPMVRKFYRVNYWDRFRGDDVAKLSKTIAMKIFDTSVSLGVRKSVKILQDALNLLNDNASIYPNMLVDGLLGKITLRALELFFDRRPLSRSEKERMLLNLLNALQGMHYIEQMRRYPERERFRGWFLRL